MAVVFILLLAFGIKKIGNYREQKPIEHNLYIHQQSILRDSIRQQEISDSIARVEKLDVLPPTSRTTDFLQVADFVKW